LTGWIVFEAFAFGITVCGTVALLSRFHFSITAHRYRLANPGILRVWLVRRNALAVHPAVRRAVTLLALLEDAVSTNYGVYAEADVDWVGYCAVNTQAIDTVPAKYFALLAFLEDAVAANGSGLAIPRIVRVGIIPVSTHARYWVTIASKYRFTFLTGLENSIAAHGGYHFWLTAGRREAVRYHLRRAAARRAAQVSAIALLTRRPRVKDAVAARFGDAFK